MPTLSSVIVRHRQSDRPVVEAFVLALDQAGRADARTTDGNGFCHLPMVSGGITMQVTAEGYQDWNGYKTDEADPFIVRLEPRERPFDMTESGYLSVDRIDPRSGNVAYFRRQDGSRWLFAGYTSHLLITALAKGDEARVHQVLSYMDEIGANTVISIGCHLSPWKQEHGFYYDPRRPDHPQILARLFDLCAEHKKRIAHASLADAQGLNVSEQQAIWRRDYTIAGERWNVLPRIGNEDGFNGWNPADFDEPPGGVCPVSRGSRGMETPPYYPYWDWAEWEPRRAPIHKAMDDAGAGIRELQHGYEPDYPWGVSVPIVVIEPAYFHDAPVDQWGDERWTSPRLAHDLGANIASNSAGGGFGASNGLNVEPLGPIADQCAREFFRGMWGAW